MIHALYNPGERFRSLTMIIAFLLFVSVSANAQQQDSLEGFVSGMRANAVKGPVSYQRNEGKFDLEAGLKLEEGDFIRSGANAYAELLLQPGNYLRVGEDSECQIVSDPYDRMKLKLNHGTVSVEILSKDGEGNWYFYESLSQRYELVRLITPRAEVFITQPGIFRISAIADGRTDLIVRKGEAVINGRRVKENRRAIASRDGVTIMDIDSKIQDNFDLWGRERAETLIQANRSLKNESPWSKNRKMGQATLMNLPDDEEQTSNPRVVSAKPGAVNFVDTGVELSSASKEWEPITQKSHLETGDKVRTSAHAFAELTMLPDINLRLDSGSEVSFEQLTNDSISLRLTRGAAILDVVRFDSKQPPQIAIAGNSTSIVIADKGNYRIDVTPNGDQVIVREGKVNFKERSVGSCRQIAGGTVSDCDKKRVDNFDFWSEHRGEGELFNGRRMLARVTHLTRLRQLRFKNTGFWFQNPGQPHYTFVPFSSSRFRSPYGGNYSTAFAQRRVLMIRSDIGETGKPVIRGPQVAPRQPIIRP